MGDNAKRRFQRRTGEIEQRIGALRERCDRLGAGAMLADSTETDLSRAVQLVELARERAAQAARRVVTARIRAADAHDRAARMYELAATDGAHGDFQAQAARHRRLAAADRAAAQAMAAGMPENHGRGHETPPRAAVAS